ncbi:hypothetical protein BJ742DRAFT_672031 [Cladochytrium replicatum]|nr:hypothetical protein BJ742DRAFT_672031 [Cladochytrium replicatum]
MDVASVWDPANAPRWESTLHKVIKAVVSLRFSQVAAFDTESAECSEASGFVVDSEKGIILTNRHVALSGPFVGVAVFSNHEEVDVHTIYRDPVHDFGFLKFDVSKIKYMSVAHIDLAPEKAKVGLEIRIVGNDAAEKLSILSGSLSRLDRNCPEYGDNSYNDFDTFYLQAASSASGGSSGSPVIDIEGDAVALQAGGHNKAATDFFLPLDRVVRALRYVQSGELVPRGTIQTQFYHRTFDEVRRLGLTAEAEEEIRRLFTDGVGTLVVEVVLPEGTASGILEEGDVLLAVNGEFITKFVPLEEIIDSSVGREIRLRVQRGGEEMTVSCNVEDLHAITPSRYVEVGGGKLNDLSFQLARQYCVPCKGVYVADASGMFRLDGASDQRGWLITHVDTKPTPNLDAFIEVMQSIPDRERIPVTYCAIADLHTTNVAIVTVDRHWSSFRVGNRNDFTGLWDYTKLAEAKPPNPIKPQNATFPELDASLGPAKQFFRSMVRVSYSMPCRIDHFPRSRRAGSGLVLDAERGIVVVSRSIIPFDMGDLTLTFADSIIVEGKVMFLHPTQNIAFISYNPEHIGSTPVLAAPLSTTDLRQGHKVFLAALNHNHRPVCIETTVTDITSVTIPQSGSPRFRAINFDAITLDTPLAQQCASGVLVDAEGKSISGLWLSYLGERTGSGSDNEYYLGLQIACVQPVLKYLQEAQTPVLRGLAIEVMPVQLSQARLMGLTDEWVRKVELANPQRRQLFLVRRTETASPTAEVLKDLDLILSIDNSTITRVQELDLNDSTAPMVHMKVIRNKEILTVDVPTTEMSGQGTDRVVFWAGALIQAPHKAVLQQSKKLPSHVYISGRSKGSPAYMYGITSTQFITHINGKATHTLDEFVKAVEGLPDNAYVRVKTVSFDLVPVVLSVRMVKHYWPSFEFRKDSAAECGWRRIPID